MVRMLGRNDLDHEPVVCAARDRIMALVKEKAALQKLADGWKFEAERALADASQFRSELAALRAAVGDDVWHYQGDGDDHPESLTCHVVMSAAQFRELLARSNCADGNLTNDKR